MTKTKIQIEQRKKIEIKKFVETTNVTKFSNKNHDREKKKNEIKSKILITKFNNFQKNDVIIIFTILFKEKRVCDKTNNNNVKKTIISESNKNFNENNKKISVSIIFAKNEHNRFETFITRKRHNFQNFFIRSNISNFQNFWINKSLIACCFIKC